MTNEFLRVFRDTSLSWIDRNALEVAKIVLFWSAFRTIVNFSYEMLSLTITL